MMLSPTPPHSSTSGVMFETLFDLIPFAIYVMDVKTYELVYVNHSMRERTQAKPGEKCYDAIYKEESPCFFCRLRDLLDAKGNPQEKSLVFENFNPVDDFWYQLQEKTLFWPDGRVVKYSIAVEVSALKETQNRLAEAHAELALKNNELKKLDQEKNDFLGIVAHDLKSPLSAVRNLAEEIQNNYQQLPQSELLDYATRIRNATQRMFMLVMNLLDVNMIESGKLSLNIVTHEIARLIESSLDDYQFRATQKNIQLLFDNRIGVGYANVDGDALCQILDNLISNALKYSPSNTRVKVHLCSEAGRLYIKITDQGPGISEIEQKKLFSKFARLSSKPTAGEDSTGLGLFIVKKLVTAMLGKVHCHSQLGQGTTFTLSFPHIAQPVKVEHKINSNLRILLAEDNTVNQKIAVLRLKKLGLTADIATTGEEVLDYLARNHYDVILMDIEMPVMDGLEATRRIRAQPERQQCPYIIAMTGHASEDDKQRCFDAGMQNYLVKPFTQDALRVLLAEVG